MEGKRISQLTPDTSPTIDDYIVTVDGSTTQNKRVELGSLPVSTAQATEIGAKVSKAGDTMTGRLVMPSTEINGVLYLSGTGLPNGVVSAPVGSVYIDKSVPSGPGVWFKKVGASTTGWEIIPIIAETQWRSLGHATTTTVTSAGTYVDFNIESDYLGIKADIALQASSATDFAGSFEIQLIDINENIIPCGYLESTTTPSGVTASSDPSKDYLFAQDITRNKNIRASFFQFKSFGSAWGRGGYEYRDGIAMQRIGSSNMNNGSHIRRIRLMSDQPNAFSSIRIEVFGHN